ncbi:MAG: UDP-2,3-diacylglucosamine diphosphatase LpxI [Xanthobacteraceae bacterium]|nr:UDP-2,3-diacylglucosamine diphosphatase LpxI [Xanthobacteraceae bacterium]
MTASGAYTSAPQTAADKTPVAIICGGGAFPGAVADAVARRGRPVHLFLLRGFADRALERYPHEWVKLGSAAKYLGANRKHGVREVVLIGSAVRPRLSQIGFDWKSLLLLPRIAKLFLGGDNNLLSGIGKIFEEHGLKLRGAHEVAPELLMPHGLVSNIRPTAQEQEDIDIGSKLLRAIDGFDVGQAVVVASRRVIAIEGAEGTAGLLARVAEMRRSGRLKLREREGVLVKLPKPSQDRRIDLPAIGTDTIMQAQEAGLSGIAVEGGGSLVIDAQKFVEAADMTGLFVIALPASAQTPA